MCVSLSACLCTCRCFLCVSMYAECTNVWVYKLFCLLERLSHEKLFNIYEKLFLFILNTKESSANRNTQCGSTMHLIPFFIV